MRRMKTMTEQTDETEFDKLHSKNIKTQSVDTKFNSKNNPNKKAASCQQIQQSSTRIVNDNLISTLHPKRTSINLNSFIQVFRKKVRQTTIAKQFQNSLQKFDSLNSNRTLTIQRQKGGFVGSFKKQHQQTVENNRFDNKIKKIIISDLQYKDKKMGTKINFNQDLIESLASLKQLSPEDLKKQRLSRHTRRRVFTYSNGQNQDPQSHTISFYKSKVQNQEFGNNPQNIKSDFNEVKPANFNDSSNKSSLVFTNRRLQTLNTYQRPNLMYNLSLYRKKNSYNIVRKSQKKLSQSYHSKKQQK